MECYDKSSDKHMGETANGMVELAYYIQDEVGVIGGDEIVIATPDDTVEDVLTKLETSADRQQDDSGL